MSRSLADSGSGDTRVGVNITFVVEAEIEPTTVSNAGTTTSSSSSKAMASALAASLSQGIQQAATEGAVVAHVQKTAAMAGVLTPALKSQPRQMRMPVTATATSTQTKTKIVTQARTVVQPLPTKSPTNVGELSTACSSKANLTCLTALIAAMVSLLLVGNGV